MASSAGTKGYLPAEDTSLLRDALRPYTGDSCLEIGFGSGTVLRKTGKRFRLAVGTDIVGLEEAQRARRPGVELVLADKANSFRENSFDLVYFNPPYLPSARIEDTTVDGGPRGVEVAISFLDSALQKLRKNGVMVALLSDEGDLPYFVAQCRKRELLVKEIARTRLFYESLVVFEIRRKRRKKKEKGSGA